MGYLDHASAFNTAIAQRIAAIPANPVRASFSALEWSVIALARNDRVSSLSEPGPVSRAFGGLFGLGRQSRLADPHLETLRRLAVHAWRSGFQLPVSEVKSFLAAGFSSEQLDLLLDSVSIKRSMRQERVAA